MLRIVWADDGTRRQTNSRRWVECELGREDSNTFEKAPSAIASAVRPLSPFVRPWRRATIELADWNFSAPI
jgi:hypothetical protein